MTLGRTSHNLLWLKKIEDLLNTYTSRQLTFEEQKKTYNQVTALTTGVIISISTLRLSKWKKMEAQHIAKALKSHTPLSRENGKAVKPMSRMRSHLTLNK